MDEAAAILGNGRTRPAGGTLNGGRKRGCVDFWLAYIQKTNHPPRIAGLRSSPRASTPSCRADSWTAWGWEMGRSRGGFGPAGCTGSTGACTPSATLSYPAMGG